jgi:mevalonate kinase
VYKVPALVGAVAAYTDCEATITAGRTGLTVVDDRPAVPDYKIQKAEEGEQAIKLVLNHFGIDLSQMSLHLTFGGTLTAVSGIGASAAQVVALARALQYELPQAMTEDEINAAGYEGEKGYHGTPSGIDNTAATFGGVLKFQRTDGDPLFETFQLKSPINIVYASTGITSSTTTVVGDVRAKKEADPVWFDTLLAKYCDLVKEAEPALKESDLAKIGELMNQNHALLQDLTVSCQELDLLVAAARTAGAIGAKMSGTGRGGLMLALTPDEAVQEAVAKALEQAGASHVWKTSFQ